MKKHASPLEIIKGRKCFSMPGCSVSFLQAANLALSSNGFARIPQDFTKYLNDANGLQAPNFILYGTEPMPAAGGMMLDSIYMATEKAIKTDIIEKSSLVLGATMADSLLVYDSKTKKYAMADATNGQILDEYENLAAFIGYMVSVMPKAAPQGHRTRLGK